MCCIARGQGASRFFRFPACGVASATSRCAGSPSTRHGALGFARHPREQHAKGRCLGFEHPASLAEKTPSLVVFIDFGAPAFVSIDGQKRRSAGQLGPADLAPWLSDRDLAEQGLSQSAVCKRSLRWVATPGHNCANHHNHP